MSETTRSNPGMNRQEARAEGKMLQFVGFRLDQEEYAIAITTIQEIIVMKPITRIPQVPDSVEGLINLRGNVIPIVSLRRLFGLSPKEFDDETRTLIVNVGNRTLGYVVDEVTQVMRFSSDQIQPAPVAVAAVAGGHIAGLAKLDDRLLIILDVERLDSTQGMEAITG